MLILAIVHFYCWYLGRKVIGEDGETSVNEGHPGGFMHSRLSGWPRTKCGSLAVVS